jgi:hypothetical protein
LRRGSDAGAIREVEGDLVRDLQRVKQRKRLVAGDNPGPGLGERCHERRTKAAGGAGNHNRFAGEFHSVLDPRDAIEAPSQSRK